MSKKMFEVAMDSMLYDLMKKRMASSRSNILKYFNGDDLATNVYIDKYENKEDSVDKNSSPKIMHEKLARYFYQIERKYPNFISKGKIFELLDKFKYVVPGGSVMYGLNNYKKHVSLGNCFVIGERYEKDSYGTIMRRDEEQIQLMKRRGGVGQDLSFIRPRGSYVNNAAITSTGVVPFAERYSNSTKEVAQDGRRGAAMLTLNANHADVMEFIDAKANEDKITGANISIKVDDEMMTSVLVAKDKGIASSDIGSKNGMAYINEWIPAEQIFDKIIRNARDYSEPGILFWDRVRDQIDSQFYMDHAPVSTNPCGELPLSPYDSCRLLAMNLYSYVKDPFSNKAEFDYVKFENDVMIAHRIMDDIVDLEIIKIDNILKVLKKEMNGDSKEFEGYEQESIDVEINLWNNVRQKAISGRRTGLGFTALADTFAALNLRYGSSESIKEGRRIAEAMMKGSYRSSIIMAKERGHFPSYNKREFINENDHNKTITLLKKLFYDEPEIIEMWEKFGRRNVQNLAIAPTGTVSIMTQTSSGIEPVFNLRYTRRRRVIDPKNDVDNPNLITDKNGEVWEEYNIVHNKFNVWYNKVVPEEGRVDLSLVSDDEFDKIVKLSPYYKSTSYEINPIDKITLQGVIQEYIDSSISVTHNLPSTATVKEVEKMAIYAWEIGCKGFTVYREGSRGGILINKKENEQTFSPKDAVKRPKSLECAIHSTMINGEKWIVLVGMLDDSPYEIFSFKEPDDLKNKLIPERRYILTRVKRGHYNLVKDRKRKITVIEDITSYFETPEEEFITRLISTSLRHGTNIKHVYTQLLKSKGNITDFSKSIARVLKKYVSNAEPAAIELCPECGNTLRFESGCVSCSCGYSKCS